MWWAFCFVPLVILVTLIAIYLVLQIFIEVRKCLEVQANIFPVAVDFVLNCLPVVFGGLQTSRRSSREVGLKHGVVNTWMNVLLAIGIQFMLIAI